MFADWQSYMDTMGSGWEARNACCFLCLSPSPSVDLTGAQPHWVYASPRRWYAILTVTDEAVLLSFQLYIHL